MYENCNLLAKTGVRNISPAACGFSLIKIYYSDYPKRFIHIINEVMFFYIISLLAMFIVECCNHFISLQSNLLLCWHGFL